MGGIYEHSHAAHNVRPSIDSSKLRVLKLGPGISVVGHDAGRSPFRWTRACFRNRHYARSEVACGGVGGRDLTIYLLMILAASGLLICSDFCLIALMFFIAPFMYFQAVIIKQVNLLPP